MIHTQMDLDAYLSQPGRSNAELAASLRAPAALVSQWRTKARPVPIDRCVPIEQATRGAVTRIDLRPTDWWQIWPELAERHPDLVPLERPHADEPEPERPGPNLPKSGNGPSPGMEPKSGRNEPEKVMACGA